ncbi:MAG: 50S ribosomal protein L22 [Candidatus Omnitrophica bacterium]|nr:50S ribosomal protein L22 [Candidatus Omnitrophota bacterium]
MISRAIARYIRTSPRKTRKVIDLIRGLPVVKAQIILASVNKRPTVYIKRLLHSALDSAEKRFSLSPSDLYISSIRADGGPMLKRHRAASMGRAMMIKHRTAHIVLELDKIKRIEKKVVETEKPKAKKKKAVATKKPAKSRR